jgi:hypothetical protein
MLTTRISGKSIQNGIGTRSRLSYFIFHFAALEQLLGPARPSDEGWYLNRHIALGVVSADLVMIGPGRLDNRRIKVFGSEVWFRLSAVVAHTNYL